MTTASMGTMTTTMNFTPVGIESAILANLKAINQLPNPIATQIDAILDSFQQLDEDLSEEELNTHRRRLFRNILETALAYKPLNFQEYIWYAKFSVAMLLAIDCPNSLLDSRIRLMAHTFSNNGSEWHTDSKKIHRVAKEIYCLTSNATNIAYVALNVSTYTEFTLFVAISLVWAAFRCINEEKTVLFRMYEFQNVIPLVDNFLHWISGEHQMEKMHNFLTLYSVYQGLLLPNQMNAISLKYKFVRCTEQEIGDIHKKLSKARSQLVKLMKRKSDMEHYILMVELLRYDILEPLQKFIPNDSLYPI